MLELTAAEVDARQFEALATDGQGSLRAVMAKDDGPARWSVDFWVTDADDVAARVPELGGSVVVEPFDSIPTRQAVVADPDGAVFSVTTTPRPSDTGR